MNRITVILLAALDAVIALGVGLAIPLVPLTVAWALQFDVTSDWTPFWRAGADIWLLGHGADVTLTLDPVASATFGLSGTNVFTVSVAALGIALLTVVFGLHTGRRAWATPHPLSAAVSGVATFAVLSALVTLSVHTGPSVPSLLQGSLLPPMVFALGIGIGVVAAELQDRADPARSDPPRGERPSGTPALPWPVRGWSPAVRAVIAAGLRGGVAASALVVAASAVLLAVLMLLNYGRIVGLYEALQPGVLGAIVLTLAQLALLPNAVIWSASWMAGPGFAIGTGSSVDVAQTSLGPLPNVPLFGVLPQADPAFGLVAVLIPVLCGVGAGILSRRRLDRMPGWGAGRLALVVVLSAVCSGIVLGLFAWWSAGAIGPGRLQHAGPNPLLVGAAIAVEVGVGAAIGIAVRRQPAEAAARLSLRDRRTGGFAAEPTRAATSGQASAGTGAMAGWLAHLDYDADDVWSFAANGRESDLSSGSSKGARDARGVENIWAPEDARGGEDVWAPDDARGAEDGRAATAKRSAADARGAKDAPSTKGGKSRNSKAGKAESGRPEPSKSRTSESGRSRNAAEPSDGETGADGGSRIGARGLVRPSAPRVPTPRGRLPRAYRERDFAEPEFARHETSDGDDG